jgi:hypothetical protein
MQVIITRVCWAGILGEEFESYKSLESLKNFYKWISMYFLSCSRTIPFNTVKLHEICSAKYGGPSGQKINPIYIHCARTHIPKKIIYPCFTPIYTSNPLVYLKYWENLSCARKHCLRAETLLAREHRSGVVTGPLTVTSQSHEALRALHTEGPKSKE